MDYDMIELKTGDESKVKDLLEERIKEANLAGRLDPKYAYAMLCMSMTQDAATIHVDDAENPQCLLVMTFGRVTILSEETAIVNCIHVAEATREKSPRLSVDLWKQMIAQSEATARLKKMAVLKSSNWVWKGSKDISSMLESSGMEKESEAYIKILT